FFLDTSTSEFYTLSLHDALPIYPKFGEAYLQLGILHSGRGGFTQAIREYKKAIEVSPQLGEPHYRLGLAYRRMGEESKAELWTQDRKSTRLNSSHVEISYAVFCL